MLSDFRHCASKIKLIYTQLFFFALNRLPTCATWWMKRKLITLRCAVGLHILRSSNVAIQRLLYTGVALTSTPDERRFECESSVSSSSSSHNFAARHAFVLESTDDFCVFESSKCGTGNADRMNRFKWKATRRLYSNLYQRCTCQHCT